MRCSDGRLWDWALHTAPVYYDTFEGAMDTRCAISEDSEHGRKISAAVAARGNRRCLCRYSALHGVGKPESNRQVENLELKRDILNPI